MKRIIIVLTVLLMGFLCFGGISFGQAIENEFYLITPVSKDVHDPALKAFAEYVTAPASLVRRNSIAG